MSGAGDRKALIIPDLGVDDGLDDFAPRAAARPAVAETRKVIDQASSFPSREAGADAQLNLKGPRHILERFKALCKADRRPYYDMLEILMDRFDGDQRN